MTTIAYRDGVMVGDTLAVWGSEKNFGFTKLARTQNALVGFCGAYTHVLPMYKWIVECEKAGLKPMEFFDANESLVLPGEDIHAVLVGNDRRIWNVFASGSAVPCGNRQYEASGSGAAYALGALAMGATAEQAVQVSSAYDTHTGGAPQIITFDTEPHPPFST